VSRRVCYLFHTAHVSCPTVLTPSLEQPKLKAEDSIPGLGSRHDGELIEHHSQRTGSVPDFEDIVRTYHRDVRLFVARFLGNDPATEDIAQEVFVQVHRSLDQFQGRASLKTWILGIARHRVGTWFREKSRQLRTSSLDLEADLVQYRWQEFQQEEDLAVGGGSKSGLDPDMELGLLRSCLQKLKPPQRELVQSFYFEEATAESISRSQGRSAGAVRMSLLRIREALAKCIRKQATREFHHE
jgi:RNA polymerase sigma-70 factor (ECF subfamily)